MTTHIAANVSTIIAFGAGAWMQFMIDQESKYWFLVPMIASTICGVIITGSNL